MGRPNKSQPQVDIEVIKQTFALRQDGAIIRRSCHVGEFAGEPSTFVGPDNRLMVRVSVGGRVRRIVASRVAWALAVGQLPSGPVLPRNGDPTDLRPENMLLTKGGARPFDQAKGGKSSALAERQFRSTLLLKAMAANPRSTVPVLSELIGSSVSCVCTRLSKLADAGLTCGPRCDARARWDLTPAGQALAETNSQHVLDGLDTDILSMIASAPMRQLELAHRLGIASLTAKRRITRLVSAGMVTIDTGRRFCISKVGVAALGGPPAPKPVEPWLNVTAISAASAKDVAERQKPLDDHQRRPAQRAQPFGAHKGPLDGAQEWQREIQFLPGA